MSNKFETEEDYEFAKGESQRELSQYQPSQGLSEEDKPPLRLKQYGVNDLSPVSETPVFTERIRRLNQAGFEAANKAMAEIEKAEIEKDANEFIWFVKKERLVFYKKCSESDWWYESSEQRVIIENMLIAYDQMAERLSKRSRLHPLLLHSEQKLRDSTRLLELAGQRIKELETELFKYQSMQSE